MKELIFATGNQNKVIEIKALLPKEFSIKSLKDIGFTDELPETQSTIEGNSLQKAETLKAILGADCFSEDTGLEIEVLNGEPGIFSARYAGESKNADDNMDLVLEKLSNKSNRRAQFKTVITLLQGDNVHQFVGILEGEIAFEKEGDFGFGYDPIFKIETGQTLAQLTLSEKAEISHRGKAVKSLVKFLQNEYL